MHAHNLCVRFWASDEIIKNLQRVSSTPFWGIAIQNTIFFAMVTQIRKEQRPKDSKRNSLTVGTFISHMVASNWRASKQCHNKIMKINSWLNSRHEYFRSISVLLFYSEFGATLFFQCDVISQYTGPVRLGYFHAIRFDGSVSQYLKHFLRNWNRFYFARVFWKLVFIVY